MSRLPVQSRISLLTAHNGVVGGTVIEFASSRLRIVNDAVFASFGESATSLIAAGGAGVDLIMAKLAFFLKRSQRIRRDLM